MMSALPLRVLIVEDRAADAELIVHLLRQSGYAPAWQRVDSEPEYLAHLSPTLDLILADHALPRFDSTRALQLLQKQGLDIPFIIVSGVIDEDAAVSAMRHGAADYLLKDRLARLGEAVRQALQQKQLREERRQAFSALRESEEYFRALIEHGSDIIAVVDAEGIVRYISPSVEQVLGHEPEALIGRSVLSIIHPDDLEAAETALQSFSMALGSVKARELRAQHQNGTFRVLEVTTRNQLDNPSVRGITLNARDISERKQAEATLNRYAQRMAILHEIDLGLIRGDSIAALAEATLRHLRRIIPCQRATVGVIDAKTDEGLIYALDFDDDTTLGQGRRVSIPPDFFEGYDARHMRVLDDLRRMQESSPRARQLVSEGIVSGLDVLLMDQGHTIGSLGLLATAPGFFTAEYQEIASEVANQLAIAIHQQHLTEAIEHHATLLEQRIEERTAELQAAKDRAEAILDNSADGILLVNSKLQIRQTNTAFNRIFTCDADDYFDQPLTALAQTDDASFVMSVVQAGAVEGQARTIEIHARRNDGTAFDAELGIGQVKGDGMVCTIRDITERKMAEADLRESEEKFRLLMEGAPEGIVISDEAGIITLVNAQVENVSGYGRQELIGQSIELLVPEHLRKQHQKHRADYAEALHPRPVGAVPSVPVRRKDGTFFPAEIGLSYIETKNGLLVMSYIADITERVQNAAALERQRTFLREVIDVSPSLIFVKDYDARFVLVNPLVAQMYNTTVETLIGKSDADFNPNLDEVEHFLQADRQVIASGEPQVFEEPITSFSGETHWLQTTKVPIVSADSKSTYVLGVATDITERKRAEVALRESEEKYRRLIETMRGGLAIFDVDDRITYVNDRFCELLGYPRDELVGTKSYDYLDDVNAAKVEAQLERRRQVESTTYEVVARRKDGQSLHLLVSGSRLLNENGEFIGSFAVTTDISVQKQAEETLRQALGHEKELSELKSRFTSMVSHEFRTPLAILRSSTDLLVQYGNRMDEARKQERFEKIQQQVGRMIELLDETLAISKAETVDLEFSPMLLNVRDLCADLIREFELTTLTHRIEFSASGEQFEGWFDPKLMHQVITNLLSNAVKYSPQSDRVRLELICQEVDVMITVQDYGLGISEEDLKRLFEPYHRGKNVGQIWGTGLGLSIVRRAVEAQGGTIQAQSELNVGTTFTIRLPLSLST